MSIPNKTKFKNNIQLSTRSVGDSEQGKTLLDDDKLNDYLTRTHVLIKKMPSVKSHGHLNATSNSTSSNSSNSSSSSSSSNNNSNNASSSIKRRMQNAGRSGTRKPVLNSNSTAAKNGCVKRKLLSSSNDSDGASSIITSGSNEPFEQTNRICKIKRVFKNNSSFEIKKCYTKRRRISNKEISFRTTPVRPNGMTQANNADADGNAETSSIVRLTNGGDGTASLFKTGELEISLINKNNTNSLGSSGNSPTRKNPSDFSEFTRDVTTTDVDSSDDREFKEHLSSDGLTLDGQYLGIRPAVKFKCYKCEQTNFKNISVLKVHVEGCSGERKPTASSPSSSYYCSKLGSGADGLNGKTSTNYCGTATIKKERRNNVAVSGFSAAGRGGEKNRTNLRITRRVYLCSACMTYYQNWDLYLHMKNVHEKQICLYCLSLFNLPIDLWSHLSNYHNVLINKYDAVDDLREALKDSFFLSCCTCNHLFSQDDDFVHHKCSEMMVDRNSYHHPKCPSLGGQSKPDIDGAANNSSVVEVTSADKSDGGGDCSRKLLIDHQSDLEENDYDISGVASFCRVALGSNNNRLSSSSSAVLNKSNGNSKLKTLFSSSTSAALASSSNVNVKTASVLPAEVTTSRDGHHVEKRARTEQASSAEPLPATNQLEVGKNIKPEEENNDRLVQPGVTTNSDKNLVSAEKLNVKTTIADSVNDQLTEKEDINDGTVDSSNAFEKDDDQRNKSGDRDSEESEESDDESKDVLTMALTLDDDVEQLSLLTVLKECIRTSCTNCLYCNNATNIATNAKQLALHLLQKHRYKPTKNSTWRDVVRKLRAGLSDLEGVYVNTESFDSTDGACHVPFQRLFACFQCFYSSNLPKELYLHKRKVHQKNLFLCSMCECSFGSYSELFCHLCPGVCARNLYYCLQYRCCLCGIGNLPSAFRLMIHLRKVHRTCDVCLEEVDSRTTLNSHLGKHKTNHLCYKCGIAYASKTDINKHLFWKHGTESVSCRKCLQKKWPFIYHVCTPQMINVCEECNTSFKKPIALTVHKRFHTNDFRHACELCGERFVSRKLTDKHRDKVHNSVKEIPVSVNNASCDDTDNNDVINEENSSAEKIDNLVDNLPPLMLSSESDDSDDERSRNKNTDRSVISSVSKSPDSNSSGGNSNNQNAIDSNDNCVTTINGDNNGDGTIKNNLSERMNSTSNAEEENIWSGLKICDDALEKKQTSSNDDQIPPVPLPEIDVNMDYFYLDHDYCLPDSLVPAGSCSTSDDKNDDNAKTADSDEILTTKKIDAKAKSLLTTNNSDSSSSMKDLKKSLSLRKNISDSSSSSSSSSEDSDSSSSCSSNCSCPRSSSSSSSSSGTESSCSDKQKCRRRHRRKLKTKHNSGANNSSSAQTTAEQPKEDEEEENRFTVNESDLYTELSSSDEEFYEKVPLILQREFTKSGIDEKQLIENKKNNGQEDNSHSMLSQAGTTAIAIPIKNLSPKKKKSKNKRNKSSKIKRNRKNNNIIDNNSNSELTSSSNNWRVVNDNTEHRSTTLADRRSSSLFTCNTMDDSNNDAVLYNHFSNDSLTDGTTTNATSFKTPSTAEQRRNEAVVNKAQRDNTNARQSKRKRVKNKFYGYSTSDEESTTSTGVTDKSSRPTNKVKKLSGSSKSTNVALTTPLQSKSFTASLSPSSSSSSSQQPQQLKLKLPAPSSVSGKSGVVSAGYSKLMIPKQTSSGLRILPPSRPATTSVASTAKVSYNTDDDDDDDDEEDDDSSDSATERKPPTPAVRFHSSKGNVLPTPSTNRILGGVAGIQSSHLNIVGGGSSAGVKNDNLYCYCQCPYDEVSEMIACDGPNCKIEWFHFECVGIMVPPKGKWFCPSCRKGNKTKW